MLNIKDMSIGEIQGKIDEVSNSNKIGECVFERDFEYMELDWCSETKKTIAPEGISFSKNDNGYTDGGGDNIISFDSLGINIEFIDGYGGEGQGDKYWGVARLKDTHGNQLIFKVEGWYSSYDGSECDDPTEWEIVKPVEKTTIVYESVK